MMSIKIAITTAVALTAFIAFAMTSTTTSAAALRRTGHQLFYYQILLIRAHCCQ
jgi:hypothetical protein